MSRYVWKTTADKFLVQHYEEKGPTWVAMHLGITPRQAAQRAHRIYRLRTRAPRGRPFSHGTDYRRGVGKRFAKAS